MRKITSRSQDKKKQKKNQIILGIILVAVISLSTLGYAFRGEVGNGKKVEYNGVEFVQQNGFWIGDIGNLRLILKYNPQQAEKIDAGLKTIGDYYNKPLYISSESSEASYEIYNNMGGIVQRIQLACIAEENCEENMPIKTCEDNFIIIKAKEEKEIQTDNKCIFISGPREELIKITDGVLLKIFRVIQ